MATDPVTETVTLRPEVAAFAEAMEARLQANDHSTKLGWHGRLVCGRCWHCGALIDDSQRPER